MTDTVKELENDIKYLTEENAILRQELTKINNVIQPLWSRLRQLRTDFSRNTQTGDRIKI